jgi:hypothetical protein
MSLLLQCYTKSSFSRKILWLEVSPTNKDSKIFAGYYLRAVQDYGSEGFVMYVATCMIAFVYSKSTEISSPK